MTNTAVSMTSEEEEIAGAFEGIFVAEDDDKSTDMAPQQKYLDQRSHAKESQKTDHENIQNIEMKSAPSTTLPSSSKAEHEKLLLDLQENYMYLQQKYMSRDQFEQRSLTEENEKTVHENIHIEKKSAPPTTLPSSSKAEHEKLLLDLQQKYFKNLELIEQLSKENNSLTTELKNSHDHLKQERKCNRLHRLLRLSRTKGEEGPPNDSPPHYSMNDFAFSTKNSRPKSADSIFNQTRTRRVSSGDPNEKKIELEEVEYRQEQAEYHAQKFQEQQRGQRFLNSLRRSYEVKPPLDWKTFQEKRKHRRDQSHQRREEHYKKWKLMNQQVEEYNQINQLDQKKKPAPLSDPTAGKPAPQDIQTVSHQPHPSALPYH
jgi:hypothetical protein